MPRLLVALAALALAGCAGTPRDGGSAVGYAPPLADGMARLRIVRSDETIAWPAKALIRVAGRPVAELGAGDEHLIDLRAGRVVITAAHGPGATASALSLDLVAGRGHRVLVGLDPVRFPAYDGPLRPLQFLRESLDAPHDDRRPLFRLGIVAETERPAARASARRAEAELDAATAR